MFLNAILDFFTDRTFFPPCNLPYKLKKYFFYPLNYYPLKVTKFHTVIVSKLRVLGQKATGGGDVKRPLNLFRVKALSQAVAS